VGLPLLGNAGCNYQGSCQRVRQDHEGPGVKKKMDQNGFKTEYMGPEESLALVKKKMVEYEVIMKELGRIKK